MSYNDKYKLQAQIVIMTYLLDHPCVDCGESNPIVLDFDHDNENNKIYDISEMRDGKHGNIEAILEEIKKCSVRCANCHRIRHSLNSWKIKVIALLQ
jgi:hypothetical protein